MNLEAGTRTPAEMNDETARAKSQLAEDAEPFVDTGDDTPDVVKCPHSLDTDEEIDVLRRAVFAKANMTNNSRTTFSYRDAAAVLRYKYKSPKAYYDRLERLAEEVEAFHYPHPDTDESVILLDHSRR